MILDIVLTVMLVLEMFIQLTGETLHEIIGVAFFICIACHLWLSRKWIAGTAAAHGTGKLTAKRRALAGMGIALAVVTVALGVSSVMISQLLYATGVDLSAFGSWNVWYRIHTVSSYTLSALVVAHLAMHWVSLAKFLHVPYNPARRAAIGTSVNLMAAAGIVAIGAAAYAAAKPSPLATGTQVVADQTADASTSTVSFASEPSDTGTTNETTTQAPAKGKGEREEAASQPATTQPTTTSQTSEASSTNGTASESASAVTGTCTLCRKNCPLSAPQCNKPYEAGLI